MRVILSDNKIIDLSKESIVIVFDTDEERKNMANNLSNMQDSEHVRLYGVFPLEYIDGSKLIDNSLKLLGYEKGIESFI